MTLFFVGVVEMIIVAFWTKVVSQSKVAMTGAITVINIFIWYYVVSVVVENIGNWTTIASYALGCAIGAMIGAVEEKKWPFRHWRQRLLSRRKNSNKRVALPANATNEI